MHASSIREVRAAREELTQNTEEVGKKAEQIQGILQTYAGCPNPLIELAQVFLNRQALQDERKSHP